MCLLFEQIEHALDPVMSAIPSFNKTVVVVSELTKSHFISKL